MDDRLAVRLLGPFEVRQGEQAVALGGPRVQALFAYLVLHRTHVAPAEQIIDGLWGDAADEGSRHSFHTHVSTLRRRLEQTSADVSIVKEAAGYRLDARELTVDLDLFDRHARVAVSGGDIDAAGEALALWRGEPLAEFAHEPWARSLVAELQDRRHEVLLVYLDARLEDGQHAELVPELRALVDEAPFREDLWERYIVALYRSGRQVDALVAFGQLEETLREELGLEPGPEMQSLQRRILLHDPGLLLTTSIPHDVPGAVTTFIGRDAELDWLASLAQDHRLVTVLGPGGVGKTRIAMELAHRLRGQYPGGIRFVDLAPLREAERVPEALAENLGVRAAPGEELAAVAEHLGGRETLLLLDNCEHLRVEVARVAVVLLRTAVTLRAIVTSRVALGVIGEVTWSLPPLAVPTTDEDPAVAVERDAVRMFVDRAAAVRPAFRLGPGNGATVIRLCQRLDGLPLALELAASRLRSLGLSEIDARLDEGLAFLRSTDPHADERHRTLAAVLDWSARLLEPDVRQLFARLSVVPGAFATDLAAAVAERTEVELVDHLDTLVAHSLLTADTRVTPTRYRMLEVVREHAAGLLDRSGDRQVAELALLHWILQLTELPALEPSSQEHPEGLLMFPRAWVQRLAAEQHSLRAALAAAHHDPDAGLTLATRLTRYWWANAGDLDRSSQAVLPAIREGIAWLERLLALDGADPDRRDAAIVALGFLRGVSGDRARALDELLEVRDRLDARGRRRTAGWASLYAGTASWWLRPAEDTWQLYDEAHERFEAVGELEGQVTAHALEIAFGVATEQFAAVTAAMGRFLALTEGATAPSIRSYVELSQALQALLLGDVEAGGQHLLRVHELLRQAGDPVTVALVLASDAWWAALAGHVEVAAELLSVCEMAEARNGLDIHWGRAILDLAEQALPEGTVVRRSSDWTAAQSNGTMAEAFATARALLASHEQRLVPGATRGEVR